MNLTKEEPLLDDKVGDVSVNSNRNGDGNRKPGCWFTFLLILLLILYSITVVILLIREINVSLDEYKDIPACASQYKWWITSVKCWFIFVLFLNAICFVCYFNNRCYITNFIISYLKRIIDITKPQLTYVKFYFLLNMCVAWVAAPISYIVVLNNSDQNCNTTHISGIVMWTRDVIIFFVILFVVSFILSTVAHILSKKQNILHEDRGMVATGVDSGEDNIEKKIHQCDNMYNSV